KESAFWHTTDLRHHPSNRHAITAVARNLHDFRQMRPRAAADGKVCPVKFLPRQLAAKTGFRGGSLAPPRGYRHAQDAVLSPRKWCIRWIGLALALAARPNPIPEEIVCRPCRFQASRFLISPACSLVPCRRRCWAISAPT